MRRGLLSGFAYAGRGIARVFREERNFQFHVAAALVVFALAAIFGISRWELIVITLVVTLVMVLEIMNTVSEQLLDALKPRISAYVRIIKDLMAGAVLLAAIGAVAVGFLVFWPYVMSWLSGA